jgi:hypothetical protein
MPPDLDTLWTLLDQLDGEAESVTFYDAITLIHAARFFDDLPQGLVADWVALHDAPHVTDGARALLGQFLKRLATKQANARRLAQQLIVLKDSGKTLRASIGHTVAVALEARPTSGLAWTLTAAPDCAQVIGPAGGDDAASTSAAGASLVRYGIIPHTVGRGTCRWEERRVGAAVVAPRTGRRGGGQPAGPRTFQLFIIAE